VRHEPFALLAAFVSLSRFEPLSPYRPLSPFVPLSSLGAARALARDGARDDSRKAYEELLRMWASADPDLPVLRQARDELARLSVVDTASR